MYYKVVSVNHNRMYSYIWHHEYAVEYIENEWVKPNIGKLFAFNSFDSALHFYTADGDAEEQYEIWECEVENPIEANYISWLWANLESFWSGDKRNIVPAPKGTMNCDAIKLIRKVEL